MFLSSTDFCFKINFKKFLQEHYQSVKCFGSRSGPTFCWSWSGSKLFAEFICRRQKSPLARKELLSVGALSMVTALYSLKCACCFHLCKYVFYLYRMPFWNILVCRIKLCSLSCPLALNVPITTKVVCFSCLLKCLRRLYGKQCGPRSDCSYRSSLFWVHTICFYT